MNNWKDYNPKRTRGKYLIKFLSEEFLFKFLETGNIWFSRADQFGDKMECVTIDDLEEKSFPFKKITDRKQKYLISCWHNVDNESLAMWDTSFDSFDKRRVYAIKFELNELIGLFNSSNVPILTSENLFGNAVYQDLKNKGSISKNKRIRNAAFRKENAFEYEKEFRFILKLKSKFNTEGQNINIGNPQDLKFTIMVNPLLKKRVFNYYEYILKNDPIAKIKLRHSELVNWLKPNIW